MTDYRLKSFSPNFSNTLSALLLDVIYVLGEHQPSLATPCIKAMITQEG
jgi:hypothetical protein